MDSVHKDSQKMTEQNIHTVRSQIDKKLSGYHYAPSIKPILNDMDHHPYTRYFRGVYYHPNPVIIEREAGWRPEKQPCNSLQIPPKKDRTPRHCYQNACSTVFPCYPEYLEKESDKPLLDTLLNRACIVQYR